MGIKPKREEYPYEWNREAAPPNKKGWRCRIVRVHNKSQGLVQIEFKKQTYPPYIVKKSGLKRVEA